MSVKRRDRRNRVLRNGESQRADGRYAYVYVDNGGNQKFIYSWKLEESDAVPKGKRDCEALRTKVKKLKKDLEDGIAPDGGNMTVFGLLEKYVSQKQGVRRSTEAGYDYALKIVGEDMLGQKRINKVRLSDAKDWAVRLKKSGKSYETVRHIKSIIKPAFQMAVDDDLIRKNPFDFTLATVIKDDTENHREGVTEAQRDDFLRFVYADRRFSKYYDAVYILFNTGLRISEFAGLTDSDIDFENGRIVVDHQLRKIYRNGIPVYTATSTKTSSGVRYIPMTLEVGECFRRIISKRKKPENEPVIDGIHGFLFLDEKGMPVIANHWEGYFNRMCKKYNKISGLPPVYISPHVCRHTFCTTMAMRGMNPKTLQYIMGHSNISITLNVYTHVGYTDAQKEMERIYGK